MHDRQSQSPARSIHIGLETSPSMYQSIFQNIHFQKHHGTPEKRLAYLDDFCRNEEEILGDSADASLDRFVVLLNWTLLSAVVYMILNSSYLFGAAFRAPFGDAFTRELLSKLPQIAGSPMLNHLFSAPQIPSPHYTLYHGLVYASILLSFVVAFLIILGKSFMGRYTLDLRMPSRRNPCDRRESLPMPAWFRLTLESLPTALPIAQVVLTVAILITHYFAL